MSDWQAEFQRRIVTYLVKNGSPVSQVPTGTYGGYLDWNWREINAHVSKCELIFSECKWKDSEWSDFAGTFAESQWSDRTGIDVIVTCQCGYLTDRAFRYTGSRADLLTAITETPNSE
jgi:hypothetical protein